jgi:hypothetical protein
MNYTDLISTVYPECAHTCSNISTSGCVVCESLCPSKFELHKTDMNNRSIKVKIIRSSSNNFWYANKIYDIFDVIPVRNGYCTVNEIDINKYGIIEREDCIEVNG